MAGVNSGDIIVVLLLVVVGVIAGSFGKPLWAGKKKDEVMNQSNDQSKILESFKQLAKEAIYVNFQCNDSSDMPKPNGQYPLAVFSEPIKNKYNLINTTVIPIFKYRAVGNIEFLFIELEFPEKKRNIVIGSKYSIDTTNAFIKAAISQRCFWISDKPYTIDAIQIPVVKPEVLRELLEEIPKSRS